MMDMLTIYIIVALFIIIPFAVPFIVISIVNRSGKSSSAPLPPGVQAYRNTAPPRMYAAPYPPRAAYPVPGQTMNAPRREKNDMTVSNVLFLIGTIFVVLSGLAFGVASWVHTSHEGRVAIICAASVVSFMLSAVIGRFLKLSGTSVSFYILGTGFISTAVLTAGFYHLMGEWLSFSGDGTFALLALGSAAAAVMLFIGKKIFKNQALMYTALSVSALAVLFAALQIGNDLEGSVTIFIILQAVITALIYGLKLTDRSANNMAYKTVGSISALIYGSISAVYAVSVITSPTVQSYFVFAVIICQLIFYGLYFKNEALIYAESLVSLLLALMGSLSIYEDHGVRYGILLFFALSFALYLMHSFIPTFRHIFTRSFTFGSSVIASLVCLEELTKTAYVPELLIGLLMSAIIGGYVFSKNEIISKLAGISAVIMPLITFFRLAEVAAYETDLSFKTVLLISYSILALIFTGAAFILNKRSAGSSNKMLFAVYTDLCTAGVMLMCLPALDRLFIIPAAICLLHFAVSNRVRSNITSLISAASFVMTIYVWITSSMEQEIEKLIVMSSVFVVYMLVSRAIYNKGIFTSTEEKFTLDSLLVTGWLPIILMFGSSRNAAFAVLMAAAIYTACFIKKNTAPVTASILLTVTTALTAIALITRPFLIPSSAEISSKITIAIVALTGAACRFIWRKNTEAARYSSNAIFILSFIALLIDAIRFDNGANTIIVMTVMLLVLIVSIMARSKTWFITSASCLLIVTLYATREYLMALNWWIYLFFAGMILIALAAVNEYCKKNNETLRSSVVKRFSSWTW